MECVILWIYISDSYQYTKTETGQSVRNDAKLWAKKNIRVEKSSWFLLNEIARKVCTHDAVGTLFIDVYIQRHTSIHVATHTPVHTKRQQIASIEMEWEHDLFFLHHASTSHVRYFTLLYITEKHTIVYFGRANKPTRYISSPSSVGNRIFNKTNKETNETVQRSRWALERSKLVNATCCLPSVRVSHIN